VAEPIVRGLRSDFFGVEDLFGEYSDPASESLFGFQAFGIVADTVDFDWAFVSAAFAIPVLVLQNGSLFPNLHGIGASGALSAAAEFYAAGIVRGS